MIKLRGLKKKWGHKGLNIVKLYLMSHNPPYLPIIPGEPYNFCFYNVTDITMPFSDVVQIDVDKIKGKAVYVAPGPDLKERPYGSHGSTHRASFRFLITDTVENATAIFKDGTSEIISLRNQ